MQDGEHDVDRDGRAAGERHEAAARGIGDERHLEAVRRDGRKVTLRPLEDVEAVGARPPAAFLVDRDGHHFVALHVEMRDDRRRRAQRYLVLARASPVHHRHPQPFPHDFTVALRPVLYKARLRPRQ